MVFNKLNAKQLGAKGGKAKVLKGVAWLRVNDPEGYERVMENRPKKYKKKGKK